MPQVNRSSQIPRSGQHTRKDVRETMPQAVPRDDLRTAFAGDENRGPAKNQKAKRGGGTHLKSRRIGEKSAKTPVR